jgi:hypothetical protein
MPNRHELENLIRGIDDEIGECRRDWKEADCTGDDEVKRDVEQNIAALHDQRRQAQDSLIRKRG